MVSGDNATVTLTGGGPWGFRLTGGGSLPLQIAKIRKKSQAHAQGLKEGDAVVSINSIPVHDKTHDEAVDLIDAAGESLTLQIYRGDADDLGKLLASKKTPGPILTPQDEAELAVTSSHVTSSTSSVQDDGRTRHEVQQNVFVTSDGGSQSTTFVQREHTVTTSSGYGDVNGNDVSLGDGIIELSKALSPGPPVSPKPSLSPRPQGSPRQSLSPRPLSPQPVKFSPAVSPQPVNFVPAVSPQQSLSPRPLSPQPVKFSPAVSPQPPFTLQSQSAPPAPAPSGPTWAPRPTFKAVPPKVGPSVAPKPMMGPPVAPKPQMAAKPSFNAKQSPQPFSPVKFQVSASAMYSQQPYSPGGQQPYSPGGQQPYSPGGQQPYSPGGQQPYSPGGQPYSPGGQPYSPGGQPYSPASQPFSPASQPSFMSKQHQQQAYSQSSKQTYSRQTSSKQQLFSPGSQPFSPGAQPFSPGGQQPFSPMSVSSPMSPTSQPFSPMSPGNAPMFNVRNNFGDGSKTWTANLWLPGQEPTPAQQQQLSRQQQQQPQDENAEAPRRMTVKERQQMLLDHAAKTHHSLSARSADPTFDAPPEEVQREMASGYGHHHHQHHKPHVFGPPVEIHPEGPVEDLGLVRTSSEDSTTSSYIRRKKKVYSDSAFYEDSAKKYPTIQEQMKLCRLISQSLTSAVNKRARGAKMFARRKNTSNKWVHEAHIDWSSSAAGDVGNIDDLDSELSPDEGGNKDLFYFRIPSLKSRVQSADKNTKMSLKKDEFERLRLNAQKCDHKAVSPGMCFDIVADLKASKGKAGRMFAGRKTRADKYIIDEKNAKVVGPKHTRLEGLVNTPLKSRQTPWEAAQAGSLDTAFDHLSERERVQKLNQILQYNPPKPKEPPRDILQDLTPLPMTGPRTNLKGGSTLHLLEGRNFNRFAKGWGQSGDSYTASTLPSQHVQQSAPPPVSHDYPVQSAPRSQPAPRVQYGDYNPRPRAWQAGGVGGDSFSCPASMSASWNSSDFDAYQHNGYGGHYSPEDLPACDL